MTRFRPCIDLHEGKVKQIVGSTLTDDGAGLRTNFVSEQPAEYFSALYRRDGLKGGHLIKLGPGEDNDEAARAALTAYPGGLQIGGGITLENAAVWLIAGASHVIITSYLFDERGRFRPDRLQSLIAEVGAERLVIDLSCRRERDGWVVAMNRWTQPTDLWLNAANLRALSGACAEILVHAADIEGQQNGIDEELVQNLGAYAPMPVTYAGGANSLADLARVDVLSQGRVDLTIGSALDIFGGEGVRYADCVAWNQTDEGGHAG
ncbi:phosphoribosylformimino-5-aminoimidazole carboxamide ribotide isomerase [Cephaloticoccus capnophilus]|uniref:Phosphoribosylformimino-5-aminoimidazole carboxamide ribotide isomerase n=1 Tax=Cephaloticoccus capnophilus TaxID=1548208 RepID=A0A139SP61_9BACT|nr:phosphoribosylformimino-5-aminoimidazole carboxamide ribotide isomerase [Cephaloticoccus capnophilus]KXU36241.1 phosphoribosylformimino-5-aminoimidazole carboxamide ribotide isomerase [Cephaloticoccus capnophilus]